MIGPDGGLQAERTALAWERTTVATVVVAVLLVVRATHASSLGAVAVCAGIVLSLTTVIAAIARGRALRHDHRCGCRPGLALLITGSIVVCAVAFSIPG